VFAAVAFPADLVSTDDSPGPGLADASRATQPDRPSLCRVEN